MFEIKGIKKNYGKHQVLKDISFDVEPGEIIGILGANGSGKSTLLSILAGLQRPDGGCFSIDGKDIFKQRKLAEQILAYVPQENPLIDELNAWDNLRMWYARKDLSEELSTGVLKLLGIDEFLKTPVAKMSGGMKKRLSIGCAMNSHPKLMLLDEPTAALDLVCRMNIYDYFKNFTKSGGSIILATHEVSEIELCDRCYVLKNGVLVEYEFDGDLEKLSRIL